MSELRDRLEALANRGTQRGADDVLRAARRDAQSLAPDDRADLDDGDLQIIDDELPTVTLDPGGRRRRRVGSFVASAGVAALIGVGVLAVTAMFGSGGADSPEGAVRQLADAVNHKDPLAAVDVLVPSEVRSMRESVQHATDRAADLQIVDEASKPLAGVDLSVDHLQLTTEPLADGYAKVVITGGEINADTHKAQLSSLLQKAWRNGEDGHTQADLATLAEGPGLPTFVVVVRQGGGWYVSPAYTTLEYIREVNQYPAADFGSAKAAELGAATPDDAVKDALHAWQAADWDRLIALAPPDEIPVYDYRAMIHAASGDIQPDFTIDHLSTTSQQSGDTAIVQLDASGLMGRDGGRWQVGGTCPSYSDQIYSESDHLCLSGDLTGTVPFGLMMARGSISPSSGPVPITVVREDGRWFVSPVSTVLGAVDSTVRKIDQRTVYSMLGLAWDLPPDGTITIDQPFEVARPTGLLQYPVYAFDGRAGQQVVGEMAATGSGRSYESVSGTLYTTDGEEVGWVEFTAIPTGLTARDLYVQTTTLPKTGSYRLVLDAYWATSDQSPTLTLWDLDHAPAALQDAAARNAVSGEQCVPDAGGLIGSGVTCTSTGVTPTTIVPGGPNTDGGWTSYDSSSGKASTATSTPATTVP